MELSATSRFWETEPKYLENILKEKKYLGGDEIVESGDQGRGGVRVNVSVISIQIAIGMLVWISSPKKIVITEKKNVSETDTWTNPWTTSGGSREREPQWKGNRHKWGKPRV